MKYVAKPTFGHQVIVDLYPVAIQNRQEKVLLNKPIYLEMAILDISKVLMYAFYCNHLQARYANCDRLLYIDTDSVIIHVEIDNIYQDRNKHADL